MTLYKHELKMNRMSFFIWLVGVLSMAAGCIFLFPLIDESMSDMSDAFASMGGFSAAFGMDALPWPPGRLNIRGKTRVRCRRCPTQGGLRG